MAEHPVKGRLMPADESISSAPSIYHRDGKTHYICSTWPRPPTDAKWAIDYGYCRTSLDHQPPHYKQGSSDPRCPRDCPHKAPQQVAQLFSKHFAWRGAKAAAEISKRHYDAHRA